jgi:hypothetical protein
MHVLKKHVGRVIEPIRRRPRTVNASIATGQWQSIFSPNAGYTENPVISVKGNVATATLSIADAQRR